MKKDWKKKRRFRHSFARTLQKLVGKQTRTDHYTGPTGSFVILAQEKYGDAILLTPLLKNIKTLFPQSTLSLLTFSKNTTDFFQSDPNIDTVLYAKANPLHYILSFLLRRFDIVFNTKDHPSRNFLIHSLLIPSRCTIGIQNEYHTGIYDYVTECEYNSPVVMKNCGLLTLLGKKVDPAECRPYIPPMPVSEPLRQFVEKLDDRSICGINISAGWPTRYWTEENWRRFIQTFNDEEFIVLSSPGDLKTKKALEETLPNIVPSPGTSNLYEAGLIIGKLKLLVTPDTSLIHVASCTVTPVVGLYTSAPQDQSRFTPFLIDYRMAVSSTAFVKDIELQTVNDAFRFLRG